MVAISSSYRATRKARGMKLLRVWVPDPLAPRLQEEALRQAALLAGRRRKPRLSSSSTRSPIPVMDVRRGDLITIAVSGDYGKPRRALVIQSDFLPETDSVPVCLLTTHRKDTPVFRLSLMAIEQAGLREASQVMIDKIMAAQRNRCGLPIGRVDDVTLLTLTRMLALAVRMAD